MKTIIAGSRSIIEFKHVFNAVKKSGFNITEIVSGTAKGVDRLGELYGKNFKIPVKQFPADWNQYGKRAGMIRNQQMSDYADALIAIYDGVSSGTKNMIEIAKKDELEVFVYEIYED